MSEAQDEDAILTKPLGISDLVFAYNVGIGAAALAAECMAVGYDANQKHCLEEGTQPSDTTPSQILFALAKILRDMAR